MDVHITAFLITLAGITLAEMGDKTQLLAMAFATKYKMSKVFTGICLSIVLLSASAVAVGNIITRFETLQIWIQSIAAISFILFGLWTLRDECEEEEEEANVKGKFGPVLTVAGAFFIAELGDKTQLATMAFAANFPASPIGVFLGGTFGLIAANAIGICAGSFICKRVPEHKIKLISASVFLIFGFAGCYQVAVNMLGFSVLATLGMLAALAVVVGASAYMLLRQKDTETV